MLVLGSYKEVIFCRLSLKECKSLGTVPTVPVSHDADEFIMAVGVMFIKSIKGISLLYFIDSILLLFSPIMFVDPWQLHLSRSGKFYYFNHQNGQSLFECPPSSVATYMWVGQISNTVLEWSHWLYHGCLYAELYSLTFNEVSVFYDSEAST